MANATFSLDKFRDTVLSGGLARTNRFEVKIVTPQSLSRGGSAYDPTLISLYCEQAILPGLNISSKSFKIFGPTYQRPMGIEYGGEGISLNFHVDRNMRVKTFFEDWMHTIVDKNNFTVSYQNTYATTITISQLDEQDNITYEIELLEAFPRNLNPMELNNSSQNQTHRLNVVFAYRYWRRTEGTTPTDIPEQIQFPDIAREDIRLDDPTIIRNYTVDNNNTAEDHYDELGNFIGRF
jgi:hypothetical protein